MERVRVVAAQSLNSFEQQGLLPAREEVNTSVKCMNVHCVCFQFGQAEKTNLLVFVSHAARLKISLSCMRGY